MNELLLNALREIRDLQPKPFTGFPPDWRDQIESCPECQSYKGHPIQCGICDTHRKPLWDRERHEKSESHAQGPRAKEIAFNALAAVGER